VEYPNFFDVPVTGGGVLTTASKKIGRTKLDVVILTDSLNTLLRFLSNNFPSMPNLGSLDKSALRNYGEMMAGISKPKLLPYHGLLASKSPMKLYFPKDPRYAAAMTSLSVR